MPYSQRSRSHHLPDLATLEGQHSPEVARVLKPGGGIYLLDFGHLKSAKSIDYFANQYANSQAELFTLDYLYSLRAAFTRADFKQLASRYLPSARVSSTFLMPFMVAVKSQARSRTPDAGVVRELHALRDNLPAVHLTDLNDLKGLFRLGGLPSRLL